ncbi:hypothetical protein A9R00_03040 [Oleispira antarctica]|uniref:histidine kinase n=1 Tax=Oleispira antarctica TaxID=188908 RepID=A0A1Y5HUM3_OLEAN|nr:hypothetical protein A9R00_03040 [Oleispira antarctica]
MSFQQPSFQQQVQTIVDSISSSYGDQFFHKVTASLAQAVDADYCFIARLDDKLTTSTTISTYAHGQHVDNFEYELQDTPCAEVACSRIEVYPEHVTRLFPKDILLQDMGIEAYVGASLKNSDNKILGIVVALYQHKIDNPDEIHTLYKLFSGRIAAEIDSNEKTLALKAANDFLEEKVTARTKELATATKHLIEQEKFASLGTLVAGIAHEINTPIGVAISATSMLQDTNSKILQLLSDKELTENNLREEILVLTESSNLIATNLQRAAGQINNFKKIAVDQGSSDISNFQLSGHADMIIQSLHAEIKKYSIEVINNIPITLYFNSHVSDYQQILNNLILNALHHGFDKHQTGQIIIAATESTDYIQLVVRDSGKGIDKNIINHIYTPFFTSTSRATGPGLGLSIVYNLVNQRFGGSIQVQSEPGKGTCFTLDLPKERPKEYHI